MIRIFLCATAKTKDVRLEVETWNEVTAALEKHKRTHALALFSENGKVAGSASREVGSTTWDLKRRRAS